MKFEGAADPEISKNASNNSWKMGHEAKDTPHARFIKKTPEAKDTPHARFSAPWRADYDSLYAREA